LALLFAAFIISCRPNSGSLMPCFHQGQDLIARSGIKRLSYIAAQSFTNRSPNTTTHWAGHHRTHRAADRWTTSADHSDAPRAELA